MKYGFSFDKYNNTISIYKIFDDNSRIKIMTLYEKNNFIHLDVTADKFKHLIGFNEFSELFEENMVGVDMNVLHTLILPDKGLILIREGE